MPEPTKLTVQKTNDISIIQIEGDVTAADGDIFDRTYRETTTPKILLSFCEQDHINSGGIAVLIDLVAAAQKDTKQIAIAHPRAHFRKVFDLVGLPEFISIFESEEEALKTLSAES